MQFVKCTETFRSDEKNVNKVEWLKKNKKCASAMKIKTKIKSTLVHDIVLRKWELLRL